MSAKQGERHITFTVMISDDSRDTLVRRAKLLGLPLADVVERMIRESPEPVPNTQVTDDKPDLERLKDDLRGKLAEKMKPPKHDGEF